MNNPLPLVDEAITDIDRVCKACDDNGTYTIAVKCVNCLWHGRLKLSRGNEFYGHMERCPNCDCAKLMRA